MSEENLTSMFRAQVVEDFVLKVEAEIASLVSGSFFLFSDRHVISQNNWIFASLTSHILCLGLYGCEIPILVAVRSKALVCARSLAGISVSNPGEEWMSVCCECCVLSGRGLCFGLITRPEESCHRGVSECDREASTMRRPWPAGG